MDPLRELELLIRSRHPLLAVETWEEERLEEALVRVARRLDLPLYVWSVAGGLRRAGAPRPLYDSQDPLQALRHLPSLGEEGVWLFKDLHRFLDRPGVVRRLRDLCRLRPGQRRTLVLCAADVTLPKDLQKVAARFELALPDEEDLRALVYDVVQDLSAAHRIRVELADGDYRRLLSSLKGLTLFEAERAITRAVLEDQALTSEDVELVQGLKRQVLAEGGLLEYVRPEADAAGLGGLQGFKSWLERRRRAFTAEAQVFGLEPPKGVILLGVQGCGKSMAARTVAAGWGLPLLRLEPGRLYDKYVGESEKNLERALRLAEHMAPCVLLVDEIEKGFAATGGTEADGGLSRRLLGRLLGWLQERRAPVFVVATCNDVHDLPPELLRKGRFDEIFFVDLPDEGERREIFALHLKRRGRDPRAFDLERLARASAGFSGAELEQVVASALYAAFAEERDLDTSLLEAEIASTQPLSVTRREEVEALRAWARERTVPAR